jgi:hypothetical protein
MKYHDQDQVADYVPSRREDVRDQVARYEATGGREGGTATSGKIRKTPVMRIESTGTYVAVASKGRGLETGRLAVAALPGIPR